MDARISYVLSIVDVVDFGLSLLLKGAVVLLVAWVLAYLLRRKSAAVRQGVWSVAIFMLLMLPAFSVFAPNWDALSRIQAVEQVETVAEWIAWQERPARVRDSAAAAGGGSLSEALSLDSDSSGARGGGEVLRWIAYTWLLISAMLLLRIALHGLYIRRFARVARFYRNARSARVAATIAAELGLVRHIRVYQSGRINMPITWGLFRPVIFLPEEASEWPDERLRVVLLHELVHVKRWDYLTVLLSEIACALYWPNPLVWLARRRLYAELERACDDRVLRVGVPSIEYVEHLLAIARVFASGTRYPAGAIAMARESLFKGRMMAILDESRNRGPLSPAAGVLLALTLGCVALTITALYPHELERNPTNEPGSAAAETVGVEPERTAAPDEITESQEDAPGEQDEEEGVPSALFLWMDAEEALLNAPMQVYEDAAASGGRFVQVRQGTGSDGPGSALFMFNIEQAGRYVLWGRILGPNRNSNSFFVSINGAEETIWDVPGPGSESVATSWTWSPLSARGRSNRESVRIELDLEPGRHNLRIRNREDGTRLDGLLITTDLSYVPRGAPPILPPVRPVYRWLDAADGFIRAPLQLGEDEEALGGRYLFAASGNDSRENPPAGGRAGYLFAVDEPGTYIVWARTIARNNREDSFWIRMNGGKWHNWNGIPRTRQWRWSVVHELLPGRRVLTFDLQPGEQLLEIAYRESEARLDRILITNDPGFVPEDQAIPAAEEIR